MNIIDRLRELDAKATKAPWTAALCEEEVSSEGWNKIAQEEGLPSMPRFKTSIEFYAMKDGGRVNVLPVTHAGLPYESNLALCAEARNALHDLIAVAEAARACVTTWDAPLGGFAGRMADKIGALRAALAALERGAS